MDIISFNEAATANGRIEKFIKNLDSNSGIVTVPKVIGAGENITIPAGRVAVLPNVQVDGTLNIEGEVFIPTGATFNGGDSVPKFVETEGNQLIDGVKTFTSSPIVPTPTTGTQAANKNYADTKVTKVTSTDNAIVRFNGTTGEVQDSGVIIYDSGNVCIGTSTDDGKHKLQVNGKIASTGMYSTSYQTYFDDSGVSTAEQQVPALSASLSPMLGGATVLSSGVGYRSHNIVGAWRSGSGGWNTGQIGTYITPGGGSDYHSTTYYLLKDNGQIGWSGGTPTLVSLSDMRKKDKKEDLVNGLEKINTLTPFIGRYKEDITDKDKVFLSAQEVQKILPEAVSEDIDGFLQLSYIDLVPLLISAVKDLTKEVENLKLNLGE